MNRMRPQAKTQAASKTGKYKAIGSANTEDLVTAQSIITKPIAPPLLL